MRYSQREPHSTANLIWTFSSHTGCRRLWFQIIALEMSAGSTTTFTSALRCHALRRSRCETPPASRRAAGDRLAVMETQSVLGDHALVGKGADLGLSEMGEQRGQVVDDFPTLQPPSIPHELRRLADPPVLLFA